MAKELIWSDNDDYVYGWKRDFDSKEDFSNEVKSQYEDGDCEVLNIQVQPCISTEEGIDAESLIPLALTDVTIENFYTAEVVKFDSED